MSPKEQFSKIMSIPDDLIFEYFELLTLVSSEEIEKMKEAFKRGENPKNLKLELAKTIIKELYGEKEAQYAQDHFLEVFSKKNLKANFETQKLGKKRFKLKDLIFDLGLVKSKSEAERLIKAGAVEINKTVYNDPLKEISLKGGEIVRVGKYRFKKIEI